MRASIGGATPSLCLRPPFELRMKGSPPQGLPQTDCGGWQLRHFSDQFRSAIDQNDDVLEVVTGHEVARIAPGERLELRCQKSAGSVTSNPAAHPPTNTNRSRRGPSAHATESSSGRFGSARFTPGVRSAVEWQSGVPAQRHPVTRRIARVAHRARDLASLLAALWGKADGSRFHVARAWQGHRNSFEWSARCMRVGRGPASGSPGLDFSSTIQ